MKSRSSAFWVTGAVAVLTSVAFTQDIKPQPDPGLTSTVLGVPLIVWTETQKPQPEPQPAPARQAPLPDPQPEQPAPPAPSPNPHSTAQQDETRPPAMVTLTGRIVREQNKYVLHATDNKTYQLDNQEKAKPYEGEQVKVIGSLNAGDNMLWVESIEPAS